MADGEDRLLPIDIERRMRRLVNDLGLTRRVLAEARDAEVHAKHEYERKRRRMTLDPRAATAGRPEGKTTAAERTAWIEQQCEDEEQAYDIAVMRREAAADHLRTLRDQAMLVSALAKSVQMSMGLTNATEH